MIYYKRKSWIKKTTRFFKNIEIDFSFQCLKGFFLVLLLFIFLLYLTYFYAFSKYISQEKIKNYTNDYLSRNSKLSLDIDGLKIYPDYKFNINLKANNIKLKYNLNNDFIILTKPSIDVNLLTIFKGYLDLNKIKLDKIIIKTDFNKNKYECFDYIRFNSTNSQKYNLKLRNLKLISNETLLIIHDKNTNDNFNIKTSKIKIEKKEDIFSKNITFNIVSNGNIVSKDYKFCDFNIQYHTKIKNDIINDFNKLTSKLNYNPFLYANKYKIYSKIDINLKSNYLQDINKIDGYIKISDLSFIFNNIRLPKNNILINFKGIKILSNFDFNLIENQYIKVKSVYNLEKHKYLDLSLSSNEINLEDAGKILFSTLSILNPKISVNDFKIKGVLKADFNIKTNFKKITSRGKLEIKNALIYSKKYNISLENINSLINLDNNSIDINNSGFYVDKSKLNISGKIDSNANTNILITSEPINLIKILNLTQKIPLLKDFNLNLNDYKIKSGYLKINTKISGKISKLLVKTNLLFDNININIISQKTDLLIKKLEIISKKDNVNKYSSEAKIEDLKLKLQNNTLSSKEIILKIFPEKIIFNNAQILIDNARTTLTGEIKNYKNLNHIEISTKINTDLKNNKFIVFKDNNLKFIGDIIFKNNDLYFKKCLIKNTQKEIAQIDGLIENYLLKNQKFNNFHISIIDRLGILLPTCNNISFDIISNLNINGEKSDLKINGIANLYNISCPKLNLKINDAVLNFKNSQLYLNILNCKILNYNFDLICEVKYIANKILFEYMNISSDYIDLNKIEEYTKNNKLVPSNNIEIKSIAGNIDAIKINEATLHRAYFEGNYKDNLLNLSTFTSELFNGNISGNININLITRDVNSDVVLKNLNMRLLSQRLKDISIAASGKLSALMRVKFNGFEYDEIIKSTDGYIKFNINNGELSQFAKLERFLQAGNILSQSILKLSLNSAISTISKKNTGYFKSIEGTIKIKNSQANIQYIKTQGFNMSLYLYGKFNLKNNFANINIFGRIPSSIASVMGTFGSFNGENILNKMSQDTKEIVKSLMQSPFEKMFSTEIPKEDTEQIPQLISQEENVSTREFNVHIIGDIKKTSSVKNFKWGIKK